MWKMYKCPVNWVLAPHFFSVRKNSSNYPILSKPPLFHKPSNSQSKSTNSLRQCDRCTGLVWLSLTTISLSVAIKCFSVFKNSFPKNKNKFAIALRHVFTLSFHFFLIGKFDKRKWNRLLTMRIQGICGLASTMWKMYRARSVVVMDSPTVATNVAHPAPVRDMSITDFMEYVYNKIVTQF